MSTNSTTGTDLAIAIEWWLEIVHRVSQIDQWHEQLPSPFNTIMDKILLNQVPYADEYLFLTCLVLLSLILIQTRALARPPPVPLKSLPKRPCLLLQFQPDDPNMRTPATERTNTTTNTSSTNQHHPPLPMKGTAISSTNTNGTQHASFLQRIDGFIMSRRLMFRQRRHHHSLRRDDDDDDAPTLSYENHPSTTPSFAAARRNVTTPLSSASLRSRHLVGPVETVPDQEEDFPDDWHRPDAAKDDADRWDEPNVRDPDHDNDVDDDVPFVLRNNATMQDLPDSFAPLLSSSYMTMLTHQLTGDLIHAVQIEGEVRLRTGRHEVPLDKDTSRPQFVLDVSEHSSGCRISAVAVIGSDGLSMEQDMNVHRPTTSRSKPMVKHAGLVFDPPLPLSNVAPTLIHFPTLFEDRNMIPTLRSIQFVRYIVDFIVSISSFLEKCLWILESQCQIHLSKVRITPIYKGQNKNQKHATATNDTTTTTTTQKSPKWRLQLAFSGHVLVFGWIPIPFISVVLPSFIIPQPHALLDYLLSS